LPHEATRLICNPALYPYVMQDSTTAHGGSLMNRDVSDIEAFGFGINEATEENSNL